ncbi:MAG TPA: c-type cytochrome [Burkholderiales bacterium]|jgi:cytochrome c553|nr:c-type cytochrome [Burkholderiales bacterium]
MRLFAIVLALCLDANAAQAQDANLARNLAAACFSCHGTNGNAQPGMAPLAGRPQADIMRSIGEFRSGARSGERGTLMPQLVKGYTDEQMALIADYFSRQKPVKGAP